MKFVFSIRILLATVLVVLIGVAFIANRVNTQRQAVAVIDECEGLVFHEELQLTQSFTTNLCYSVTSIQIPRVESASKFNDAIGCLPELKLIEITDEYDGEAMEEMSVRFPGIVIKYEVDDLLQYIGGFQ